MKRILILLLIGLLGLSCFFVGYCEAASITSLSVENGASGCYASLTTDEGIWVINWYAKQTYPEDDSDDDYVWVHTSSHPAGTTSVIVNIGWLDGHIKIAEYDIKAEVIFENANHDPDTAVDSVDAYGPIVDSEWAFGVSGRAELWSQYYDGNNITIDCYTSTYNPSKKSWTAFSKFTHSLHLNGNFQGQKGGTTVTKPLLKNGGTYSASSSDFDDPISFSVGKIGNGQSYKSNAYIRLTVPGIDDDTWHINHNEEFTDEDNR